jgi:hypothetical protein
LTSFAKSLLLNVTVTVLLVPTLAVSSMPEVWLTLAPSEFTKPLNAKLPAAKVAAVPPSYTLLLLPVSVAARVAGVTAPMLPLADVGKL